MISNESRKPATSFKACSQKKKVGFDFQLSSFNNQVAMRCLLDIFGSNYNVFNIQLLSTLVVDLAEDKNPENYFRHYRVKLLLFNLLFSTGHSPIYIVPSIDRRG